MLQISKEANTLVESILRSCFQFSPRSKVPQYRNVQVMSPCIYSWFPTLGFGKYGTDPGWRQQIFKPLDKGLKKKQNHDTNWIQTLFHIRRMKNWESTISNSSYYSKGSRLLASLNKDLLFRVQVNISVCQRLQKIMQKKILCTIQQLNLGLSCGLVDLSVKN